MNQNQQQKPPEQAKPQEQTPAAIATTAVEQAKPEQVKPEQLTQAKPQQGNEQPTQQQPRAEAVQGAAAAAKPLEPKGPRTVLIMDTTATQDSGPRTHLQMVNGLKKSFTFKPQEPLPLPIEVATKFLRQPDVFKLVDEKGEFQPYKRQPKQPEELGAGEKLELAEDATIARFDELSMPALMQRTLELPGGEKFAIAEDRPERAELVAFLIEAAKAKRAALKSVAPDVGPDEFIPDAVLDEDAA